MSQHRKAQSLADRPASEPEAWHVLGSALAQTETVARSIMCAQMAMTSFIGSRARARLEFASDLTRCRSPQDVLQANSEFWLRAGREYAAYGESVAALWQRILAVPALATDSDASPQTRRDLIRMPEGTSAGPQAATSGRPRHAA